MIEKHWTEQRLCGHPRTAMMRLAVSGGTFQVRQTCVDCGHRTGPPEPFDAHPRRDTYPVVEPHPDPCPCHAGRVAAPRMPERYADYLASAAWKAKRAYYLAAALHRCRLCCRPGGPGGRGLNVHHRTYERVGRELDVDVIVLCRECHARHHGHIAEHAA